METSIDPQTLLKKRVLGFFDELRRETKNPELLTLLDDWEDYITLGEDKVELVYDSEEGDSDDETADVPASRDPTLSKYTLEQMNRMRVLKAKGWSFESIKGQFRQLHNASELDKFIEYAEKGGIKYMKYAVIDEAVARHFEEAYRSHETVHDRDLQEWALIEAKNCHLPDFKASPTWLHELKKRHRIVGRKITKQRTRKTHAEKQELEKSIKDFQLALAPILATTDPANVLNSDQLGINLELTEGRTLAKKGAKHVEALVQSVNATTHSLSLQPEISADGRLMSPLLVVFREQKEPRCFQSELAEFNNLWCRSTTSGKLTTAIERGYIDEVLLPRVSTPTVMLVDSWGGYKGAIETKEVEAKPINFHIIPKGATGRIQPLDVYFTRPYKEMHRRLCCLIRRRHPDHIISKRKNLGRLISRVQYQFTAKRFLPMIQYAWFASGYYSERPASFRTPAQYCLHDYPADTKCDHCEALCMLRCAHCEKFLCFDHGMITV